MKVEIHSGKNYVGVIASENVYLHELDAIIRSLMVARRHLKAEKNKKDAVA